MVPLLAVLVIVACAALWFTRRDERSESCSTGVLDWLPARLLDAELLWSEKEFQCLEPVPITVRIDRAYRSRNQELTLIEFKHRAVPRSHSSDVVELSVQRYVLQKAGHVVSKHAYVVVVSTGGGRNHALPVVLEDAPQVERRAARLLALRDGQVRPAGSVHAAVCRGCGHRDVCSHRLS